MTTFPAHKHLPPPSLEELGLNPEVSQVVKPSGDLLPKPKKFRFQLLADFVEANFSVGTCSDCRLGAKCVADH